MASNMITTYNNFDASKVNFSDLRKNKMGGKVIYLSGAGRKKLMIEMPKMRAPFGLSEFVDQNTGKSSWSVNLSLEDQDDLKDRLQALDDAVVNAAVKNSKKWLGKDHSATVIRDALYSPIVKMPADDKYSPTIKLKVMTDQDGKFKPEAYNIDQEPIELNELEKGQGMSTIIEISQIWIINNKFGVSVRLSQALLHPTDKLSGFAFRTVGNKPDTKKADSSDDEIDDDEVEYVEEEVEVEEGEEIDE